MTPTAAPYIAARRPPADQSRQSPAAHLSGSYLKKEQTDAQDTDAWLLKAHARTDAAHSPGTPENADATGHALSVAIAAWTTTPTAL